MAVNDPITRIDALIARGETEITREFIAAVAALRDELDLEELAELLRRHKYDEAFARVGIVAARLGITAANVYARAGSDTADFLTKEVGDIIIGFDQTNYRAVDAMRNNQLRIVREFTEQQRKATQGALIRGIENGANPIEQARAFRDSIGLTSKQEEWVANYRRQLENLDRRALDRALRDRRNDATIRRAIEENTPLTEKQINRMVEKYRKRMIKYRSEVIARTESLRSVHEGVEEMYQQAIAAGELLPEQIVFIWNTAADERVRDYPGPTSHRTMHLQEQVFGMPFISGGGNYALHPGQFGIAYEDIQCRCVRSARILTVQEAIDAGFLAGVLF